MGTIAQRQWPVNVSHPQAKQRRDAREKELAKAKKEREIARKRAEQEAEKRAEEVARVRMRLHRFGAINLRSYA